MKKKAAYAFEIGFTNNDLSSHFFWTFFGYFFVKLYILKVILKPWIKHMKVKRNKKHRNTKF